MRVTTEEDREGFEAWARSSGAAANDRGCDNFFSETMRTAYEAWQACAAHHAPKLSEKEALDAACKAFDKAARRDNGGWVTNEGFAIAAALRAAGVRFKEEA